MTSSPPIARVFEQVEEADHGAWHAEEERLFTQRLFNRLLFLIFLERKGWLTFDGAQRLSARAVGGPSPRRRRRRRGQFLPRPPAPALFQRAEHAQRGRRGRRQSATDFCSSASAACPISTVDLFEEDATDRNAAVVVPDRAVDLILKRLLYHYNFTITESTPLDVEVAVDPEMLGKIFEELVTGRHEQRQLLHAQAGRRLHGPGGAQGLSGNRLPRRGAGRRSPPLWSAATPPACVGPTTSWTRCAGRRSATRPVAAAPICWACCTS